MKAISKFQPFYKFFSILMLVSLLLSSLSLNGVSTARAQAGATYTPAPLSVYTDMKYGYSFLYPSTLSYKSWEPTLDILSSVSFFDSALTYIPGKPEIAVTVFDNHEQMPIADWVSLHSNPDFSTLPAQLQNSAALFENAGRAQAININGMATEIFPQVSQSLTAGRILIDNNKTIVSIAYTDFGNGGLKDAFEAIVASFQKSGDVSNLGLNSEILNTIGSIINDFPSPPTINSQGVSATSTGYKLPWVNGVSHTLMQGWGGTYSHNNTQMWYAYDFDLNEGEEVRAVRGGTVSDATGNFTACGGYELRNSANRVTINHDDGTATLYLHLKQVNVQYGATVSQRANIGLAGKVGWTGCAAHLHFQRQAQGIWITNSQAIYFDEYPGTQLSTGSSYTSQNGGGGGGGSACPGPSLSSPGDGYVSTSQTVNFSWSAVSGCTFIGYTFRIKDTSNMDMGGNTIQDTGEGGTSRSETIGTQWNNKDLYWGVRATNAPNGASWSVRRFRIEPGSSGGCSPNADQVAFYVDTNYSGTCVVKGIGNYPDPGSMGIPNDSLSSVKVGSNVKLTLYVDSNYGNTPESFTGDDPNLSDNTIGNDSASSAKVESRPTGGSCTNGATSAALQSGYSSCANEGGTCAFSGQASVAYGANNCFFYQTFTSNVSCSNGTFGDPIVGTGKTCYFKILTPAPSANFDAWPQNGTAPFTSAMHIVDTSNITSCSWDYGDGQTGSSCASLHNHTYNNAGTFTVSLTVNGPGGSDSMTRVNYITVASNVDSYEPDDTSGTANWISSGSAQTHSIIPATDVDWVKFQLNYPSAIILETTGATASDTRMWLYDSNLNQIDYNDDKGGGNLYSYIDRLCGVDALPAGIYFAKVDEYGNNNEIPSYNLSFNITQNCTPPSANFDAWPQSGDAPFTATMHIVDTSNLTSCLWNYGDGQTGTSCASTHDHIYNNSGTYTVGLTVSGPGGSDSMTRINYITVSTIPHAPSNFTVSATTNNSVSLSWQDNSNNETGFKIYRWGYDGTQWTFIYLDTVGANVNTYTQTGLSCGSDFNYYEVSAYNADGESAHAGWVQGTTAACPVSDLAITNISFHPTAPFTNDDVWVYVDVTNLSSNDAPGFWADFYIDGQPTGCSNWGNYWGWSSGLAAKTTTTFYVRLPANSLSTGTHQFRAFVDSGCQVTESSETNNISNASAFTLTIPSSAPPTHDDFNSARQISTISYNDVVDVSGATTASDDPSVSSCGLAPGMASVWYQYTPSANAILSLDTLGSNYDTYIAVWTGSRGALAPVACNDDMDNAGHVYQSKLQVSLTAGTTYYFEVAEYSSSTSALAAASTSTLSAPSVPPGATSRSSDTGTLVTTSATAQKPAADIESLAGGTLNFHVSSTNATVNTYIGGNLMGSYSLSLSQSTRQNYSGVDSGPVKVETLGVPIIAAMRDSWWNGSSWTSYVQLMGLPASQVSDTYMFPAYNNVTLDEQLRFGNVGVVDTTVTVTIGGIVRGTYLLHPSEAKRVNYDGLDSGPVIVQSSGSVPIIAAMRDSWWNGSSWTSYAQLMGLPAGQLSDTYVFPAYNNVTLDEQLRFGNVGVADTTVTVTIGGIVKGTYLLHPSEAKRVNYDGLDSGPVVVQSSGSVPIIAAMRDSWWNGTSWTSYVQLMGLPMGQLSDTYMFPAYNNVTLDEQLRFGNVGVTDTTVTVTIGGVVRGTYLLHPNEAVRVNYDGLDSGPVKVQNSGSVPIIAAIRDSWWNGTSWTSYAQLMGLPASQLSNTYLFPAYNNVTLDEQLRFGVP